MSKDWDALRIADWFEGGYGGCELEAAAELRRLHALNAELVEALRGCVTALDALWQPADSIYTRASDAAERALAKVEASNGS